MPAKPDEHTVAAEAVGKAAAITAVARRVEAAEHDDGVAKDPADPHPRELWAQDMAVRTEDASREPDGSLPLLPTYDYQLGPDGLPYAVAPGVAIAAPEPERAPLLDDAPPDAEPPPPEDPPALAGVADDAHADAPPLREPKPAADEHVLRSYARLDEAEAEPPPRLDTIA